VAPERIEKGLEEAMAGEGSFLEDSPFSPLRYRQLSWLNNLRLGWDNLNYGWQRWVLGYQSSAQLDLLQNWFGEVRAERLAIALLGIGGVLLGLLALWLLKPWQARPGQALRQYQQFERILLRHGLQRGKGEGPRDFAERAALQLPAQAAALRKFIQLWEAQHFAGQDPAPVQLQRALRSLRRALPWRFTRVRNST
jgi:hypothetical protein